MTPGTCLTNRKALWLLDDLAQKLLDARLVNQEGIARAQAQQKSTGGTLVLNLVKSGVIQEDQLLHFLSDLFHVPIFNLAHAETDLAVTRLIPAELATKFLAFPVSRTGRRLKVAMANPGNLFAIDDIKFITGYDVEPVLSSRSEERRVGKECRL